jgi:hypothetical protein
MKSYNVALQLILIIILFTPQILEFIGTEPSTAKEVLIVAMIL